MDLLRMQGRWSGWVARLYDAIVGDGVTTLYARLADEIERRVEGSGCALDVGCGPGNVVELVARRRPELQVVGVDLSETMIERAHRRTRARSNVGLVRADAGSLPFADASFRAAWSVASIKHWPDPARGVRELARVVAPGSPVWIVELDPACTRRSVRAFASQWRWVPPGTHRFAHSYFRRVVAAQGLRPAAIEQLMRAAGLIRLERTLLEDAPVAVVVGVKPEA